jgi:RNA polymerase sigma-70 factor (ECF subfamily)
MATLKARNKFSGRNVLRMIERPARGGREAKAMRSTPSPPTPPNSAEFDALYEKHSREVWALAYARWMDADAAMDVAQETFLRLWKQWNAGEIIHNPRAWLLRVARNLAEDFAKSAFRRNGTHAPQNMTHLHSREPVPLDALVEKEQFAQIRELLHKMPETDREILTLRYALDYSTAEIADMLEINAAAVHMRLSRARQRFAERLSTQGVVPK